MNTHTTEPQPATTTSKPTAPLTRDSEQSTEPTLMRHWKEAEQAVRERKAKEAASARRDQEVAARNLAQREAERVRFAHD